MDKQIEKAIKEYQCTGCVNGPFPACFEKSSNHDGCSKHVAGTRFGHVPGRIFLGLPKGFNRQGPNENTKVWIISPETDAVAMFDLFNVAVWKHLDGFGNTIVRVYRPRVNDSDIYVFIGNRMSEIGGVDLTDVYLDQMD